MRSVVFVCTANQCRSPMAMALFRRQLAQRGMAAEWRVESAGTWARAGVGVAPVVHTVLREWGIDLQEHRARCVSRELLHSFDVILVMERGHREALLVEFPGIRGRVYLLSAMVGAAYNIPDPIAGSLAEVRAVVQEIDLLVNHGFARIVALANGSDAWCEGTRSKR